MDVGNRTQVITLGRKLLYVLSHLADPGTFFSLLCKQTEFHEVQTAEDDTELLGALIKPSRKTKKIEAA